jgi:hypothetical protein
VADQPRRKEIFTLIFIMILLVLARIGRRQLTAEMVESMLYNTPPKHRGSKKFFQHLEDGGIISNVF